MNNVFVIIISISLLIITVSSPDAALTTLVSGATNGMKLAVTLFPIYAIWLSVLKLIENTSLDQKLARIFRPFIRRLFKNVGAEAENHIAVNMTANFLGMGGAGTQAGINAIKAMDDNSEKANDNMLMLFVINCTSIQLIPTTLIALRGVNGSASPADIILPALVNTIITTSIGILLVKVFSKK